MSDGPCSYNTQVWILNGASDSELDSCCLYFPDFAKTLSQDVNTFLERNRHQLNYGLAEEILRNALNLEFY